MATTKRGESRQSAKQQRATAKRPAPKKKGDQPAAEAARDELPETRERSTTRRGARRRG